ncbi:MAG: TraR/DksA C4-type zinc finger protein [Patescibacteria group bacterium]
MEIEIYKGKLVEELKKLESELSSLGIKNENNDWEALNPTEDDHSDPNDNADAQEEFGEKNAIIHDLEIRFDNVKKALKRIEAGTYGKCEICGKEIEKERLNANPAATTCIEHM